MEPEAVRAHSCVFAVSIFPGQDWGKEPLAGFASDHYRVSTPTTIVVDLGPL